MTVLWCAVILLFVFTGATQARTVYDFESASQVDDFSVPSTSTLEQSTERYKDGSNSMKWTWASGDSITHSFTSDVIDGNELKKGGIKLWIYSPHYSSLSRRLCLNLTVSFQDTQTTPGTPIIISRFNISLSFKGWRAIWVSYSEALVAPSLDDIDTMKITAMKITAPTTALPAHPLYFDLVRLVDKVSKQSRDKIVPTIGDGLYTPTNFWQQTYRWSQVTPTAVSSAAPDAAKLADLSLIEKRIDDWFVSQTQSSTTFTGNAQKRWESLLGNINTANVNYGNLNIAKSSTGVITGKPLYARDSEYDDQKFGYVMEEVLLPLALGYYIRSRTVEVDAVATLELSNLNSATAATKAASVARIAGADTDLQGTFTTALGSAAPYTLVTVKEAINILNDERKDRLLLLLDYVKDQGFTAGSAIGSLDHIMNTNGAGFCNSVYLLREVLGATRLAAIITTMKWYSDFGEIYQDSFEYDGTTTDRMRTIALYRLYAILMMSKTTVDEKKEVLRDMAALGRWYENALTINEGWGGVVKPDYTGFHHNGYYASAYFPQALHMATYIEYLLSGTSYAFDQVTSDNIQKGLEFTRIVSVKYSSPNSVGGRFPGFSRAILAKTFPAYAYHGATAPVLNADGSLGAITTLKADKIKMFLRLYDTTDTAVTEYLEDGTISNGIFYLNSIGSINSMEEIIAKATALSISAESSPKGFWSKNYAALVVHRREDWAVSMKGFNKFVWDFEASGSNNVYGLYQSHGALLVANSEEALKTMDMDKGWDWTRHPGTTTIKMDLDQLISKNRRYFQPKELAGGLVLYGGGDNPTGIFGMDFSQPTYQYAAGSFQLQIDFEFKKSVFFADNTVISLGSGITAANSSPYITQTTLFQNKLVDTSNPSSILIGSTSHSLGTDLTKTPTGFPAATSVTLRDVNGNGYYIPNAREQGLNVKNSEQTSKKNNGKPDITSGKYSTAWFDHGSNPSSKDYEYAIIVNKPNSDILSLQTSQDGSAANKVYEVLQKDNTAHVVKINNSPRTGETQTGYVFFDNSARPQSGTVMRVDTAPCIVMVEEVDDNNLYIAVSSPNLNFNIFRTIEGGFDIEGDERFYSYSQEVEIQVFLRGDAVNVATGDVKQDGTVISAADKTDHVEVVPSSAGAATGLTVKFKKLAKGFSTEVKLTRP